MSPALRGLPPNQFCRQHHMPSGGGDRPGNAGANTVADHITVLEQALAQIPDAHRHGTDILIRTDSAGGAKAFLHHIRALRSRGIRACYSVGHPVTEPVRRAIPALPEQVWHPALEQDGSLRHGAQVAELTGMVDLDGYPADTRIIVRRERPHPGAQLSSFDLDEGMRHPVALPARRPATDITNPPALPSSETGRLEEP